jgi:hypothetical protein
MSSTDPINTSQPEKKKEHGMAYIAVLPAPTTGGDDGKECAHCQVKQFGEYGAYQ